MKEIELTPLDYQILEIINSNSKTLNPNSETLTPNSEPLTPNSEPLNSKPKMTKSQIFEKLECEPELFEKRLISLSLKELKNHEYIQDTNFIDRDSVEIINPNGSTGEKLLDSYSISDNGEITLAKFQKSQEEKRQTLHTEKFRFWTTTLIAIVGIVVTLYFYFTK